MIGMIGTHPFVCLFIMIIFFFNMVKENHLVSMSIPLLFRQINYSHPICLTFSTLLFNRLMLSRVVKGCQGLCIVSQSMPINNRWSCAKFVYKILVGIFFYESAFILALQIHLILILTVNPLLYLPALFQQSKNIFFRFCSIFEDKNYKLIFLKKVLMLLKQFLYQLLNSSITPSLE